MAEDDLNAGSDAPDMSADTTQAGLDGGDGSNAPAEQSGADGGAPDYTPPSREAWESLQKQYAEASKYAEVGRRYAPHTQVIDELMARGLTKSEAKAEVKAQSQEQGDDEFSDIEKYGAFWEKAKTNPAAFRNVLRREALAANREKHESYDKLAKEFGDLKRSHDELRGWAIRGQSAFQTNPDFVKHESAAMQLVNEGRIADLNTAVEFVKAQEELKALRAKAAGVAAKTPAKPSPRTDASGPRAGVGKSASPSTTAPVQGGRNRISSFREQLASAASKIKGGA